MEPPVTEAWVICRIPKADLCFFRYTLESYEGLCVPTTLAGGEGRVRLATTARQRPAVEALLSSLAEELPLTVEGWHREGAEAEPIAPPHEDPAEEGADMVADTANASRARVIVSGRVQGVWFRASTKELAQRLDLNGWVRNLPTGEVEAMFEGPRHMVEKALEWCREGPPAAQVDFCDEMWEEPSGEPAFEIRH